MKEKLNKYWPFILLFPLYFMLGITAFWYVQNLFIPASIAHVVDVTSRKAFAGQMISVTYNVIWNRSCLFHNDRFIKNGTTIPIDSNDVVHTIGSDPHYNINYRLPSDLHDGTYYLFVRRTVFCNFLDYIIPNILTTPEPVQIIIDNAVIDNRTEHLEKTVFHVNEPIKIIAEIEKRRVCPGNNTRIVYDNTGTIVERFTRPILPSTGKTVIPELLQLSINPGKYTIVTSVIYDCPEQTYEYNFGPYPFEVIK